MATKMARKLVASAALKLPSLNSPTSIIGSARRRWRTTNSTATTIPSTIAASAVAPRPSWAISLSP